MPAKKTGNPAIIPYIRIPPGIVNSRDYDTRRHPYLPQSFHIRIHGKRGALDSHLEFFDAHTVRADPFFKEVRIPDIGLLLMTDITYS